MKIILFCFVIVLFLSNTAFSITLDEAIKKAIEVSYILKEQKEVVKKSEFSYISTIDPYLPRVDLQSSYMRSLSGSTYLGNTSTSSSTQMQGAKDAYTFAGTISYRLFDGGERYAKRKEGFSLVEREKERSKGIRVDVLFSIKNAFYTALGKKFIVEDRREAFTITEKIYGLTKARYEEGVSKKSDVLQAEVNMTTAKIELYAATKDYEKALEEVKSLLLFEPGEKQDVEGTLGEPQFKSNSESLIERAIKIKPDVSSQAKEVERLNMVYREKKSSWFPKIDAELQQTRQDKHFFPEGRSNAFMLNFTFPLFDGTGRYYNVMGALSDVNAAQQRLEEIKRNVKLDITNAFKDYELSMENVKMYRELIREATSNFNQAFGEYKVGKGDILTLLQSEKDLAKAKENLTSSIYKANTSLSNLEKVAYINVE